ncbi:transposase family protein [Streptomyces chryseus]
MSRAHLGDLVEELAVPWTARCESALQERRGGPRRRAAGAGPNHRLVFTDRVLVTLAVLRLQLPHAALAALYRVSRPTITRAVHEIRPLLARRGFAVPDRPGVRLRTLADVFAYADTEGVDLRIDGTEVQVRRPRAGRPGRKAFVSGKKKQNTAKTTTICDPQGRVLWSGADRPGRQHDQTAMRTEGIAEQLRLHPQVRAEVDEGYRGLATEFPNQVSAPPKKPKGEVPLGDQHAWCEARRSAVLPADLRGARHRRAEEVAAAPAVHRPPRALHRDACCRRGPSFRSGRPQADPPPSQHRTGARRTGRLLITHQPDRQACTP